jgi:hypothetical protein
MTTADQIRNELIVKLLSIHDCNFLLTLDNLVTQGMRSGTIELSEVQAQLIQWSEEDLEKGNVRDQDELFQSYRKWLRER